MRALSRPLQSVVTDYELRYCPGKDNEAADCMSRIIQRANSDYTESEMGALPRGLKVLEKVDGGGNSFFQALMSVLELVREMMYQ